ncbi:Foldase YidC [Leptospira kirschneri serovar Mozdok]|nr:Foldase YidC [Leptospira kirschneri serovar Mozdok]
MELSRDKGFDFNFSDSLVEISDSPWNYIQFSLTEDKINHSVSFSAISPDRSYQLKKEFRFYPNENYFKLSISIVNLSNEKLSFASQKNIRYLRTFGSLGPYPKDRPLTDRDTANFFSFLSFRRFFSRYVRRKFLRWFLVFSRQFFYRKFRNRRIF